VPCNPGKIEAFVAPNTITIITTTREQPTSQQPDVVSLLAPYPNKDDAHQIYSLASNPASYTSCQLQRASTSAAVAHT
jgi:hypothetical protein